MTLGRRLRPALLLGTLALAACAPTVERGADAETSRLFARAYEEIDEYYVAARTAQQVALPGLARLSTVDPALEIGIEGDALVVRREGASEERFAVVPSGDNTGWGRLTAAAIATARADSAKLAALSEGQVEKLVFAGVTGSLDRFTRYLTPEAARAEHAARDGFDGIGVTLERAEAGARIAAIVPDGPAQRAGLAVGDRIVAIDGTAAGGLSQEEIVERLRGPANSVVSITVLRAGETLEKSVTRAYVVVPTVTATRDGGFAIIRISGFNKATAPTVLRDVERLAKERALRGIILDLRGNPGGLFDQAIAVARLFVPSGTIVATAGRNPESHHAFEAKRGDIAGGLPMAVLVNGGSASSAEIVAAALQDSGRAVVVGSSSYGKGTVQMVLPLPNEGELVLTWARLLTPAGYVLHEHGVVPALCTAGLSNPAAPLPALMRRVEDSAPPRQRAELAEEEWRELRGRCPGETAERPADIEIAKRLLGDASLYAALRRAEPPAVAGALPAEDSE